MRRFSLLAVTVAAALMLGCSGGGDPTSQPAPATTGGGETVDTTAVVLEVSGMSCAHNCAPRAERALASLPGVANAKVDFTSKTATCELEEGAEFDAVAAMEALTAEGFEGKLVSDPSGG